MKTRSAGNVVGAADAPSEGGSRANNLRSPSPQPVVSIIVVVFRECAELRALLDNLTPFRSPDTELIVIDGGSKDGSVQLLQQKNDDIDFWLSQPDKGIYDAMNKGIAAARGEYILHINAGDRLLRLPIVQLKMFAQRQIDVVCCRVLEDDVHLYTPRNNWLMRIDNTWHHQGTFYRKSAHLGYDTSYRVFGDFDHNQRLGKANSSVELLDVTISTHNTNGVSHNKETRQEVFRSIRDNFGEAYLWPAVIRFRLIEMRSALRHNGKER